MNAPVLDIEGLDIAFPMARPVQNLSFQVGAGETLAVVGESGSGKSLTALAVMGLLPPRARIAAGSICFGGRDLTGLKPREMQDIRGGEIGMIFQEPMTSLNPVMTIGRQITEVIRQHDGGTEEAARGRAAELLDLVRIPDPVAKLDAWPHELSGGMRQRVMIAMAVACRPSLLIADEPTTALDVTIQAQVLDLIDGLRRDLGIAVLLITHDLGLVAQWADRVVVMYAGRPMEIAGAEALFARPRHPYSQGLISASPRAQGDRGFRDGPLPEIPGNVGSAASLVGCSFAPRCPVALPDCATRRPALRQLGAAHAVACPVAK